jgi:hypothetical protein
LVAACVHTWPRRCSPVLVIGKVERPSILASIAHEPQWQHACRRGMGQCRANAKLSPLRRACTSCSHRHQRSSYRPPAAYIWSLRRPVSGLIVAPYIFLTAPRTTCNMDSWLFFMDICTTETATKRQVITSQPRQGQQHRLTQCASRWLGVSMVSACHRGISKFPDVGSQASPLVSGSTRDGRIMSNPCTLHPSRPRG